MHNSKDLSSNSAQGKQKFKNYSFSLVFQCYSLNPIIHEFLKHMHLNTKAKYIY